MNPVSAVRSISGRNTHTASGGAPPPSGVSKVAGGLVWLPSAWTNPVVGEPNANLNYQAPEVVPDGLYDGGPADIWQCGLILLNMVCLSHLEAWDTSQGCPWKMAADPWAELMGLVNKLGRSNKCFGPVHACWVPVYRFLTFFFFLGTYSIIPGCALFFLKNILLIA